MTTSTLSPSTTSSPSAVYVPNANNLIVAGFAALLILLLLSFILGVLYICAKLGRARDTEVVTDTTWVHSSFGRGGGVGGGGNGGAASSSATTAAMYRPGGGGSEFSWDIAAESTRRQAELAQTSAMAMGRPAFFGRTDARVNHPSGYGAAGIARGSFSSGGNALVRAALPRISEPPPQAQRCQSIDDNQPYDQLRMQRLALSGPFMNENAISCDSLSGVGVPEPQSNLAADGDQYISDEYLDVLVKK